MKTLRGHRERGAGAPGSPCQQPGVLGSEREDAEGHREADGHGTKIGHI